MALKIEKQWQIEAPIEEVWDFLTDPYKAAQCMSGAEITRQVDPQTYEGMMTVKVGPIMAKYRGQVRIEKNRETYEVVAVGRGQDTQGKGGAEGRMVSRFRALESGGTEVTAASDVNLNGRLVQFGRGLIDEVAEQYFRQFTAAVRERLEKEQRVRTQGAPGPAPSSPSAAPSAPIVQPAPLNGFALLFRALLHWIKGLLGGRASR